MSENTNISSPILNESHEVDTDLSLKKMRNKKAPLINYRQHSLTSGKFVQWVNQIEEKFNANLEENASRTCHESATRNQEHLQINEDDLDRGELWFKLLQLATEILLMIFAASLLIIVAVVVCSTKTPAFMDSYEIVPEILFILCILLAAYSLARWFYLRIKSRLAH